MSLSKDLVTKCRLCGSTSIRWLFDEDGEWKNGEEPIQICSECGEEQFAADFPEQKP